MGCLSLGWLAGPLGQFPSSRSLLGKRVLPEPGSPEPGTPEPGPLGQKDSGDLGSLQGAWKGWAEGSALGLWGVEGSLWACVPSECQLKCSSPHVRIQRQKCKLSKHSVEAFAVIPLCIGGWNLPLFGPFPYNQTFSSLLISIFHRCLVEPRNPAPALR